MANSITDRFRCERAGDGYRLTHALAWELGYKGSGLVIIIPSGTKFDSSVPRLFRWAVSPHHAPWLLGACVHDHLLALGHPRANAAAEWLTGVRAMGRTLHDSRARFVRTAYLGICFVTVR